MFTVLFGSILQQELRIRREDQARLFVMNNVWRLMIQRLPGGVAEAVDYFPVK